MKEEYIYSENGDIPFARSNNKILSVGTPGDSDNVSSGWSYSPSSNQVESLGRINDFKSKSVKWEVKERNGIKYVEIINQEMKLLK